MSASLRLAAELGPLGRGALEVWVRTAAGFALEWSGAVDGSPDGGSGILKTGRARGQNSL